MTRLACTRPLSVAELTEYWLDELGEQRTAAVEEHLFACASCNAQLENIVSLGMATRELMRQGKVAITLTPGSLDRLKATGLRLREYRLDPGGSVNCTIAPDDDFVVSNLHAPLAGVRKLDLVLDDVEAGWDFRVPDIGFDPTSDAVIVILKAEELRRMHQATQRMRLFSMDETGEHLLGEYVFHHTRQPDLK